MKCKLFNDELGPDPDKPGESRTIAAGTLIDHRDAYKLVYLGVAESVDAECRDRTAPLLKAKQERQAAAAAKAVAKAESDTAAFGELLGIEDDDDE
jgi:hypothetical protein